MSTVSWGSAFPTTWPRKRIKYLCRFAGGGTPDKGNPEYWNGEIPWVSPKDMKSATVDDTEDHITTDGLESSAAKLVAPGAVLLVMRSGILRHSIPVAINRVSIALNQDMRALIPFPQVEARFLARLLEGHQQQLLNVWSKVGSTVESLESDLVGETEIAVPVLDQQRAIADYLDRETARLDALVAAKKRVLGLLAEKRRSLITRAVTRGLDPHAPLRDSGIPWLGEIPAHWEQCHLKRVLVGVDYGVSIAVDTEGAIAVLRMGDLRDGDLDYSGVGFVEKVDEALLLQRGDLVFNRTNSLDQIGKVALFRGKAEYPVSFASYLVRFRCGPSVLPEFLNYLLNSSFPQAWGRAEALPAIGQANLNPNRFGYLPIALPPLAEQREIVRYISRAASSLQNVRAATEQTITLLKERRSALIASAVTGQIDMQ